MILFGVNYGIFISLLSSGSIEIVERTVVLISSHCIFNPYVIAIERDDDIFLNTIILIKIVK